MQSSLNLSLAIEVRDRIANLLFMGRLGTTINLLASEQILNQCFIIRPNISKYK